MRERALTLPFALIGAVGGGLFAHLLREGVPFVIVVTVTTAFCAAGLARLVENARTPASAMGITVFGAPLAGALNGVVVMFLAGGFVHSYRLARYRHFFDALIGAGILGALVSLLFIVPLALVTSSASAVHARPGSIAWDSQRRRVVRMAATASVVVAGAMPSGRLQFPSVVAMGLALTLVFVAITEWDALRSLVDVDERWSKHEHLRPRESIVDLGVGNERWAFSSGGETYRDESALFIVWGDAPTARAILRESSRSATLSAALGIACVALRLLFA
ncbi:MAG: hypothetical protein ACXVEF_26670 [Polyangiales bacterium]